MFDSERDVWQTAGRGNAYALVSVYMTCRGMLTSGYRTVHFSYACYDWRLTGITESGINESENSRWINHSPAQFVMWSWPAVTVCPIYFRCFGRTHGDGPVHIPAHQLLLSGRLGWEPGEKTAPETECVSAANHLTESNTQTSLCSAAKCFYIWESAP